MIIVCNFCLSRDCRAKYINSRKLGKLFNLILIYIAPYLLSPVQLCEQKTYFMLPRFTTENCIEQTVKKGKAVALQTWSSKEVSRKLRFPVFIKTAQDVGKVVNLRHRPPLPPGNTPGTHFC
jgi:hypothetical protein